MYESYREKSERATTYLKEHGVKWTICSTIGIALLIGNVMDIINILSNPPAVELGFNVQLTSSILIVIFCLALLTITATDMLTAKLYQKDAESTHKKLLNSKFMYRLSPLHLTFTKGNR